MKRAILGATFCVALFTGTAQSATLTADELLGQYNGIIFGNFSSTSDVEGSLFVGGDAVAVQSFNVQTTASAPVADAGSLVVAGDISTPNPYDTNIQVNNGGAALVGEDVNSNVRLNMNGNGAIDVGGSFNGLTNQTFTDGLAVSEPGFADRFPQDVAAVFTQTSNDLKDLGGTALSLTGTKLDIDAAPVDGTAVFKIDIALLSLMTEVDIDLNGADSLIVNVLGATTDLLGGNPLGGTFASADNVIWNFVAATDVNIGAQGFFGTILAPLAHVTTQNPIEGTLIAASADLNSELHSRSYQGDLPPVSAVPLPASLPMLGLGALALGFVRRRRIA